MSDARTEPRALRVMASMPFLEEISAPSDPMYAIALHTLVLNWFACLTKLS